jgi:hypothetical protein
MNILINPYTGTDSRIDNVYERFHIKTPVNNILENECASGVCKLSTVKLLPLDLIEKEIIKTSKYISTIETIPTVYIFTIYREDMDILVAASKNWNELIQNGILKIILIDN